MLNHQSMVKFGFISSSQIQLGLDLSGYENMAGLLLGLGPDVIFSATYLKLLYNFLWHGKIR